MLQEKKNTGLLRWMTFFALIVAALPMALTWRATGGMQAPDLSPRNWANPPGVEWVHPDEIAVQLRPGADENTLADLSRKFGASVQFNHAASEEGDRRTVAKLAVPTGVDPQTLIADLEKDPRVEVADVVHIFTTPVELAPAPHPANDAPAPEKGFKPNDPRYGEQWNFQMIKMEEAWLKSKGKGAIVAVIDTGVAYENNKKGIRARDFAETKFTKGLDVVNGDSMPNDDQGHGTHVAGTIAESTNNKEGVAGIAFEATIMPIKVLSATGGGSSADIGEGIRWAADHGAKIINMSLGGPFPDKLMRSACTYAAKKGVTIVCAAGNSGREGVGYPAAFPECIAVSSVGPKGDLSFYSTWGKEVAIAAPGGDKQVGGESGGILQNTINRDSDGKLTDDYFAYQGTSMASPHVAGVAALIVSEGVTDPKDVKAILQKSAQSKSPSNKYGAGILDASSAVKLAGSFNNDRSGRFWMVGLLFVGCFLVGKTRQKSGAEGGYPFWGTAAIAFGLLFPDWLSNYLGMTSPLNIVGHSILIPGALLVMGVQGKMERRLVGWMAFGLLTHLGWEFLHGTVPVGFEVSFWQLLPWVGANIVVGLGLLIAGLEGSRD